MKSEVFAETAAYRQELLRWNSSINLVSRQDTEARVDALLVQCWDACQLLLEAPLARVPEWIQTFDPETGEPAKRDANTMPQWAGSCWYFLRFTDPDNQDAPWSKEAEQYWMPVDLYVGGAEHAVLHLLYARFWHKVFYDVGLVHTKEPFQKLVNQGMILGDSYRYYDTDVADEGGDAQAFPSSHVKDTDDGAVTMQEAATSNVSGTCTIRVTFFFPDLPLSANARYSVPGTRPSVPVSVPSAAILGPKNTP